MAFVQPHILPAMAEVIHRQLAVARGGRLARSTLEAQILPGGTAKPEPALLFAETLRELVSIEALLDIDDHIVLPAMPDVRERGAMRNVVRKQAMAAELSTDLWQKDELGSLVLVGARDLVRTLAWFLALSVTESPYHFDKTNPSVSQLQEQHTGERLIGNRERWLPFVRWARYLGFLSDVTLVVGPGAATAAVIPDPTRAVLAVLPDCAPPNEWVPLRDLLPRLAVALPVLDGGMYRRAIIDRGTPEHPGDCSPSLTLAFRRLAALGYLDLEVGAGDATKVVFANNQGAFHALRWTRDASA